VVSPRHELIGCWSGDRELEDEPWLTRGETLLILRRSPAELTQSVARAGRLVVDLIGDCLAQPRNPLVSDRRLDRFGTPAPGDRRRADPYAEGTSRVHMISQGPQPF